MGDAGGASRSDLPVNMEIGDCLGIIDIRSGGAARWVCSGAGPCCEAVEDAESRREAEEAAIVSQWPIDPEPTWVEEGRVFSRLVGPCDGWLRQAGMYHETLCQIRESSLSVKCHFLLDAAEVA